MEWWLWLVIAAAVLLPLGLLGLAAAALRRRLAELDRVMALATEQGRAELTGINRRSAQLQERLATIRTELPHRLGRAIMRFMIAYISRVEERSRPTRG